MIKIIIKYSHIDSIGRYPELLWRQDSRGFQPGVGNRVYESSEYLRDKSQMINEWTTKFKSSQQNVFEITRKNPSSRIQLKSTLKLYDYLPLDGGMYQCGSDYAYSTAVVAPFAGNKENLFPVKLLDATPRAQGSKFGVALRWSTPFSPSPRFSCESFRENRCDDEQGIDCDSSILQSFVKETSENRFRFDLGLFPLDRAARYYFSKDRPEHKTMSKMRLSMNVDDPSASDTVFRTVEDSKELLEIPPSCSQKVRLAIVDGFLSFLANLTEFLEKITKMCRFFYWRPSV